jgi:hypothetical protein
LHLALFWTILRLRTEVVWREKLARIKITVYKIEMISQLFNAEADEHLVARAIITLQAGEKLLSTYADIKQTPGGAAVPGDLEVSWPAGYKGPFAYGIFRDEVAQLYCKMIGPGGAVANVGPDKKYIQIEGIDMRFQPYSFEFEAPEHE